MREYDIDLNNLVCLSIDGAVNMDARHNCVVHMLQGKIKNLLPDSSLTYFYWIILQQNLCSKILIWIMNLK